MSRFQTAVVVSLVSAALLLGLGIGEEELGLTVVAGVLVLLNVSVLALDGKR